MYIHVQKPRELCTRTMHTENIMRPGDGLQRDPTDPSTRAQPSCFRGAHSFEQLTSPLVQRKIEELRKIGYTPQVSVTIGYFGVPGRSEGRIGKRTWSFRFQRAHEAVPENDVKPIGFNSFCTAPEKFSPPKSRRFFFVAGYTPIGTPRAGQATPAA